MSKADVERTRVHRIRLGIVGLGVASRIAHLPGLEVCDDFTLVAVADRDEHQTECVPSALRPIKAYTRIEELLECEELEALIIATPDSTHFDFAALAMQRGLHVLIEKPMARSVVECNVLWTLARQNGVVLAVGHEKRFHPTLVRVGEMLAKGVIGDAFYMGVHWATTAKLDTRLIPKHFERGYRWRWSDERSGGGLMCDHLPHYIDLVRHWTKREPIGVYADVRNIAHEVLGWDASSSRWEDLVLGVVRFEGGLTMRLETATVGRSLSPLWSLGSGRGEWSEYGYLLGSQGALVFDLLPWDSSEHGRAAIWQSDSAVCEDRGWTQIEQPEPERWRGGCARSMFSAQLAQWARAIRSEPSTVAVGEDGRVTVAVTAAGYESARKRAEVPISGDTAE